MDLHRLIFTKSKLAGLPEAERSLLLLLGHASNEINVLTKLILMTRKDAAPSAIVDHVESGQACILLRVLVGKLHEAWELFKKRVQANRPLADTYLPRLDGEGIAALSRLNRHFGKSSLLTAIRNKIAFHYKDDDNLTEESFQSMANAEPLEFYLTNTVGNCFYRASELIVMFSAIKLCMSVTASDEAQAVSKMFDAVIDVSHDITELFTGLIAVITQACMPDLEVKTENLSDGPKLSTLSLPYFVDFGTLTNASPPAPARLP
jgi:hypothetical protein